MVDTIYDHIDVQTILQTASVAPTDFGLAMVLIDDPQIPADVRIRRSTPSSYTTDYTSGTTPYSVATAYWSQTLRASELAFGRWVDTAIPAQFTCGTTVQTVATWAAISDGSFGIAVEGILAGAETQVPAIDFSSVTTFADVLAEINTELHAIATAAYADYDAAIDSLGRVYFYNPDDPGASSASVTISAGSTGTDIYVATLLNAANGSANAGLDAETPVAAINAISAIDDDWYCLMERGATTAEQVSISTDIAAKRKTFVCWVSDTDAKNPAIDTDAGKQIFDLSHTRTYLVYSEETTEHPDAVITGRHLPAVEGTVGWAWNALTGVTASGDTVSLTASDKDALGDKGYNWVESVQGITYTPTGLTADGNEMRHIIGRDWFNDRITVQIFNAQIQNNSLGFNYETFGIIEGIIRSAGTEAITRGFAVNTEARPFTVTMPDPDDYDATTRATHVLTMNEIFKLYLDAAVYDIAITGTWSF